MFLKIHCLLYSYTHSHKSRCSSHLRANMEILNNWQRWILPLSSREERREENHSRSRSLPSSPRLWTRETAYANNGNERRNFIQHLNGDSAAGHRNVDRVEFAAQPPYSPRDQTTRSVSPVSSTSDSESDSVSDYGHRQAYHSNGTRYTSRPAEIFSSRSACPPSRSGRSNGAMAGSYHPPHPSSPTLVEMYQTLKADYKELEEDHEVALKKNVSLVRSIGELERALASARMGRLDAESNPIRELREANTKLREELREKTLQVS
jgi:hypothetical protein